MDITPPRSSATSPVASAPTSAPAAEASRPSLGQRVDSFNKDVERGLKEAETGIKNLFHRRKGTVSPTESSIAVPPPAPVAVLQSPTADVLSPPVDAVPPSLTATIDLPPPVLVPAHTPRVAASLTSIAQELKKLIDANGGELKLAEEALEIITGALNNPTAEASIVFADLGKIISALLQQTYGQSAH